MISSRIPRSRVKASAICARIAWRSTLSFLDKAFDLKGKIKLPEIYSNDSLTK